MRDAEIPAYRRGSRAYYRTIVPNGFARRRALFSRMVFQEATVFAGVIEQLRPLFYSLVAYQKITTLTLSPGEFSYWRNQQGRAGGI
jgi:hypothetical protein